MFENLTEKTGILFGAKPEFNDKECPYKTSWFSWGLSAVGCISLVGSFWMAIHRFVTGTPSQEPILLLGIIGFGFSFLVMAVNFVVYLKWARKVTRREKILNDAQTITDSRSETIPDVLKGIWNRQVIDDSNPDWRIHRG